MKYTVDSLQDVANYFRTLASDQRGCVRFQQTKKAKDKCLHEAYVWEQAAEIIDSLEFTDKCDD